MTRAAWPAFALRAAQSACALGAISIVWAAATAWRVPGPISPLGATSVARTAAESPDASISDAEIARTVARDPFSDDRSAPAIRYRIVAAEGAPAPVPAPALVRLVGTVVVPDGRNFAMCQVGSDPARIVYPGQRVGSLTLESVSQGSAVFTDNAGARVTLRVPKAGS
jgi:hypothetical protein